MKLILLLLVVLTCLGVWEMARHAYHRRRIPVRVHVNGSRGKSSVARLIAAGLRAGGIRTMAKTTGSAACLIHPDGNETRVRRRGGPNIREQLGVFRAAVAAQAKALVLECMAIRPDLQHVCEHRIVHSTLGVITNARPDHLEIMGPHLAHVAANLARTVPRNGHLLTADADFADFFAERARENHSRFILALPDEVSEAEMAGFSYVEFPENVSLALSVCTTLGVTREQALAGMYTVQPDVGALRRLFFRRQEKELEFVNAFAANDPVSTLLIWERLALAERGDEVVILVNIRADRQRRSKDLAPLMNRSLRAGHYVLIGGDTGVFADLLRRQEVPADKISNLGGAPTGRVWDHLWELCRERAIVFAIGNIAGAGSELLNLMQAKETSG